MDTFFDSSWYFLRFLSPDDDTRPWDPEVVRQWAPVDQYTGGAEHAIMHLLYARFFIKGLRDIGMLDFNEPFLRLFNQGHIISDGAKMSKSRGNVVNPDAYVELLGADVVRLYLMFVGPWESGGEWQDAGINGVARWLVRLWDLLLRDPSGLVGAVPSPEARRSVQRLLHQTVRRVHRDIDTFNFNTAVAALMELSNELARAWEEGGLDVPTWRETRRLFLLMLAPLAPHFAEELWERTGGAYSIHRQPFPQWDDALAAAETVTLVVQVDGRVRDRLTVSIDIAESEAVQLAMESPNARRHLEGRDVARTIYVPGRLVNVVTR